jgi:hypothetical protein
VPTTSFYLKGGDDKVIMTDGGDGIRLLELLIGKDFKPIPKEDVDTNKQDLTFFKVELPVSECGKYLLIRNPLAS